MANQITKAGESFWDMNQWGRLIRPILLLKRVKFPELWADGGAWGRLNFSNKLDQWYLSKWIKVLKQNIEDDTINFERSNKISQKVDKLSIWLGNTRYSAQTCQLGCFREVEFLEELSNWSREWNNQLKWSNRVARG